MFEYIKTFNLLNIFVITGKPVHNCKVGCCSKPWHEWLDVAARIIYPISFIAFAGFYGIYVSKQIGDI